MGKRESDDNYNKKVFQKIKDAIQPKEAEEEEDTSPDSPEDESMIKMINKQVKDNEIPLSYEGAKRLEESGAQDYNEGRFLNTRKLIDSGKIGSGSIRGIYKKIKKSNPT